MSEPNESRRNFLFTTCGMATGTWLAASWPGIAAAAEHAHHAAAASSPQSFQFLSDSDAADVDAIAAQILPSGAQPGAHEARAMYFIDRALATFFSPRAAPFRLGLAKFQQAFRAVNPAAASFAAASPATQYAFLETIDRTEFFESMRVLTILGTLSSSQYGGNHDNLGWKLIGFEDKHVFTTPFGYYDRDYPGFTA